MSSASTQYCPNCGESNPIDAQSCWNCGQALPTSDERQELWATRGAEGADRSAARGDEPAGGGFPNEDRSSEPGRWSGAATEPFTTSGTEDPARPQPTTGGARDTRTYPTTWGAPNPDASGRQRAAGQPTNTGPASDAGYGPGGTGSPTDAGGSGPGYPTADQGGYAPGGYEPGLYGQGGSDQSGYGQSAYPSWNPAPRDEYAAQPPGQPTPGPYGPGTDDQGQYGHPGYGTPAYGQPDYGADPYAGPAAWGGGAGGVGPGGPVMAQTGGARGPSGCLLGVLGVVLIALVGAALIALVAYNAATGDQLRDGLRDVAATEVTRTGPVDVPEDGRLHISEADVNRTIRRYTDDYGAISDPTLAIAPDGVVLNFSVLGIDSAYRAGLITDGGQLRLTNPQASGAAARVLDANDMVAIVEPSLNDILRQSGVTATGVELGDGELTVLTAPGGATPTVGTPAAGTPVATPVATGTNSAPASAAPSATGPAAPPDAAPSKPGGGLSNIFNRGSGSPAPSTSPTTSAAPASPQPSGSIPTDIG